MLSKKVRQLEKWGVWVNSSPCYEDNGYDDSAAQDMVSQCIHETQERVTGSINSSIGGSIRGVYIAGNG